MGVPHRECVERARKNSIAASPSPYDHGHYSNISLFWHVDEDKNQIDRLSLPRPQLRATNRNLKSCSTFGVGNHEPIGVQPPPPTTGPKHTRATTIGVLYGCVRKHASIHKKAYPTTYNTTAFGCRYGHCCFRKTGKNGHVSARVLLPYDTIPRTKPGDFLTLSSAAL